MCYQNYVKIVYKRKGKREMKDFIIATISKYVSLGDILHRHIYVNQYWDLTDDMLVLQCAAPCILSNIKLENNTNNKTIIDNYSSLNRAYQDESAYRKNLHVLQNKLRNINYNNIVMINQIFLNNVILSDGDFDDGIRMMKHYKLGLSDLEIMIRMSRNNCAIEYEDIYKKNKKKIKKSLA